MTYRPLLNAWDSAADAIEYDEMRPIRYGKCYRYLRSLDRNARLLEVGCGEGSGQMIVRSLGFSKLVGVDVSYERLIRAKQKLEAQSALIAISPDNKLPFRTASFDAVVSAAVIEHTLDPAGFVREIARVVRPGGYVVISSDCWQWRILQLLGIYRSVQPIDKAPFPTSLFRIFKDCNFQLLHYEGFCRPNGEYYFVHSLQKFFEAKPVVGQLIKMNRMFKRIILKICRLLGIVSPSEKSTHAPKLDYLETAKGYLNESLTSNQNAESFLRLLFYDENVFFLRKNIL